MPALGVGLAAPVFGAIAPGSFGILGGAAGGGGLSSFLGPATKMLGGIFGGAAEGVGESLLGDPGFNQDRFFRPRPFEGPELERFGLSQDVGQFGLGAGRDIMDRIGIQSDEFGQFRDATGNLLSPMEVDELRTAKQNEINLRARRDREALIDVARAKGERTAGFQEGAAGEVSFLDKDLLTQLGVDILDRGEGGLIPGIVEQAFGPFAEKGRQALEEELAGMGLLTAGGASSTRGAEARGSFEAELAAAKAGQSGTLLGQFLQPFGVQAGLAEKQSGIFGDALRSGTFTLPASLGSINEFARTGLGIEGDRFSTQEKKMARELQMLGIAPTLASLARQPQITLPTGSETTERRNILPSTLDLALGTGLKGLGTTIGLMTGKSIFGDGNTRR